MSKPSALVTGLVSKVIPFSCVDGPGNRFVIFLQGCNFNCKNCHNPQTIHFCNHCGDCVEQCPAGALSLTEGQVQWNSRLCESCDQCLDVCPISSSPMVERQSVERLLIQIKAAAPFLDGATVSGGEATVQLKFVAALFAAIKQDESLQHLSCLIDSNGYLPVSAWETVLPVMDGAMIDLKGMDDDLHCYLTGRSNRRVLESIQYLHSMAKLTELRLLIIPGQTDTAQEQLSVKTLLASLGGSVKVRVNAFSNKAVKGEAKRWPSLTVEEKELYLKKLA